MKGLFAWVGFRSTVVSYVRDNRAAGQSKFNMFRLLDFAIQGFTSFSILPLRLWHILGLLASTLPRCSPFSSSSRPLPMV